MIDSQPGIIYLRNTSFLFANSSPLTTCTTYIPGGHDAWIPKSMVLLPLFNVSFCTEISFPCVSVMRTCAVALLTSLFITIEALSAAGFGKTVTELDRSVILTVSIWL